MWSTKSVRKKFFRHQNSGGGSESRGVVRIRISMVKNNDGKYTMHIFTRTRNIIILDAIIQLRCCLLLVLHPEVHHLVLFNN